MSSTTGSYTLHNCSSVKDYFRQKVTDAIDQESVSVMEDTQAYLVNLLTFYTRTDHFFEHHYLQNSV